MYTGQSVVIVHCREASIYLFKLAFSSILLNRFLRFLPPLVQFSSSQHWNSPRIAASSS